MPKWRLSDAHGPCVVTDAGAWWLGESKMVLDLGNSFEGLDVRDVVEGLITKHNEEIGKLQAELNEIKSPSRKGYPWD